MLLELLVQLEQINLLKWKQWGSHVTQLPWCLHEEAKYNTTKNKKYNKNSEILTKWKRFYLMRLTYTV